MTTRFPSTFDPSVQTAWNKGVVHNSPVGPSAPVTLGFRELDAIHAPPGHTGLDLAADLGTPIILLIDSYLVVSYYDYPGSAFGNHVLVRSGEMVHLYAHMQAPLTGYGPGDFLATGTLLGTVGTTGFTSGPHLHWGCGPLYPNPTAILTATPPLWNPMGRFYLPPLLWADVQGQLANTQYEVHDQPDVLAGARQVVIEIMNPYIIGPVSD